MNGVYNYFGKDGYGSYRFEDGQIGRVNEPATGILTPGFVDLHIHGAFGIDFMSATSEQLQKFCRQLQPLGYEGLLLTTITASSGEVQRAFERIPDDPMILGVHLEGPFISPEFPGAQPPESIEIPPEMPTSDWEVILDDPRLKLVTLAPEIPRALELILRLRKRGVAVSIGHTNGTYEEARRAFEFGANNVTHTFNAMRGLHHREAGTVGYVLNNPNWNTELIYDRIHVCYEAAQLLIKSRPATRLLAVSDSSAATGLAPGSKLRMWGHDCVVDADRVSLASNGALAGSKITLFDAFQNLSEDFGPEVAIPACCLNPRRVLGLPEEPKVWLKWNLKMELQEIIRASESMA